MKNGMGNMSLKMGENYIQGKKNDASWRLTLNWDEWDESKIEGMTKLFNEITERICAEKECLDGACKV